MRRRLAIVAFGIVTLLSIDPLLLRYPFGNRPAMTRFFTRQPDRAWPGYPEFLDGVRMHTEPGDSIALVFPSKDGYSYAFFRASYFLSGRQVLPIVRDDGAPLPANIARAKYVAAWHAPVSESAARIVWSGDGGVLLGR